ncbi:MAG: methyltransferase domain-containing protein [Candidatus Eisenbacteria bacterium]
MAKVSRYVHGTHREEQQRLADLNTLINSLSLTALGPQPGERVLEVGAGLGQFARAVATATGERVVAVERSPEQLGRAQQLEAQANDTGAIDWREGDALALPLTEDEWGSFDVAHARFLLEHVPDPQAVVDAMAKAVRPGGRVVIEDDDHEMFRPWPEPPHVLSVWRAYIRTYDRLGNDPLVGRRLVQLLASAGLKPSRIDLLPFGACSGQAAFEPFVCNLIQIFTGAREAILATGGASEEEFEGALASLTTFAKRSDGAFWYTISWAEALKP